MREIHTEIEIEASADRVWEILTDLPAYAQWNSLIHQASGKLEVGQKLNLDIHPPGLVGRTFQVLITSLVPNREFRWLGKVFMRGFLDGDHTFLIEPINPTRVRVVQSERFRGLLVPFAAPWLVPNMKRGFEEMNLALKTRAEQPPEKRSEAGLSGA